MSSATFEQADADAANAAPSSATGARFVCHGTSGSSSSSSAANRPTTSSACGPSAASVPAAPPSWAGKRRPARRSRASRSPESQSAARYPNRRRDCRLQQRARRGRRRAIGLGDPGALDQCVVEIRLHERDRGLRDEHRPAVDDVLAGRAVVDISGSVPAHPFAKRANERLGRVADRVPGRDDRLDVEELDPAGRGDRAGQVRRHEAHERLGVRQRPLGLEHGLDPGAIGHGLAELAGNVERVEGHGAKNTVSCAPCSRMSNLQPFRLLDRHERRPPLGVDAREHGIGSIRHGLVREVHAGHQMPQEAAREHGEHQVRSPGLDGGLERHEREAAVGRIAAPEAVRRARARRARPSRARRPRRAPSRRPAGRPARPARRAPSRALREPDVEERADRLRRRRDHSSSSNAVSRRRTMSNRKPSAWLRDVVSRSNAETMRSRGLRIAHGVEDRVVREQRVAREVHLGDEPLRERAPEQREVDVRRPPGVRMVPPRVGAGLDCDESVAPSASVRQRPPPLKFGSSGAGAVDVVAVAAGGVGLPDLDERVAHRTAVLLDHPAADDDPLAQRPPVATAT